MYTGGKKYVQSYLYLAIQEIASQCPGLGAELLSKYNAGTLSYDDVADTWDDIAHSDIGTGDDTYMEFDTEYYTDSNRDDETTISYLVVDIVHEAGHGIGGLDDDKDANGNYITEEDSTGRYGHVNRFDSDWASGDCPS
jgi:hypothetical protein